MKFDACPTSIRSRQHRLGMKVRRYPGILLFTLKNIIFIFLQVDFGNRRDVPLNMTQPQFLSVHDLFCL
jgi:hypothetical protein